MRIEAGAKRAAVEPAMASAATAASVECPSRVDDGAGVGAGVITSSGGDGGVGGSEGQGEGDDDDDGDEAPLSAHRGSRAMWASSGGSPV